MEKLIILDFSLGSVDIYDIDSEYEPDMEELLDSLGHRADDCHWMFAERPEITFHKEVLCEEERV